MRVLLSLVACMALGTPAWSQQPPPPGPREIYQGLNAIRVDGRHTYYVRELVLRRDVVRIFLTEGKLAFLEAHQGKVIGAVFTGQGRVIAYPRDPIERRSLARFLGPPLLDLTFTSAYLRFTDHTPAELQRVFDERQFVPVDDPSFAREWEAAVTTLNPWHSLRVLTDWGSSNDLPYFYAGLHTDEHGPLDIVVDWRREEEIGIGQPRWVDGVAYYDVWAAFPSQDRKPLAAPFDPTSYTVETTIRPDLELEGSTLAEIAAVRGGERVIELELSRQLQVDSVTDEQGRSLDYFQNEEMNRDEATRRGNDTLVVVLPEAPAAGTTLRLRVKYRGRVISDAGNGAFYVGARGIWYPNLGAFNRFAKFDLSFRWPRNLQLVANGKKIEEGLDTEYRTGRWVADAPMTIAGFNLGNYDHRNVETDRYVVEVYANKQLEAAMVERLRRYSTPVTPPPPRGMGPRRVIIPVLPELFPPSPADHLDALGKEVVEAIRFNEALSVPFPFQRLAVAQIPGSFGQGWPGLLYLSTLSFLSESAQSRIGTTQRTQEQYLDLVPPHEVAHQWWGNLVSWPTYRDQWIHEGLSNYLALMFAESRKPNSGVMRNWLDAYRKRLATKEPGATTTLAEAGPLVLGRRLVSSKSMNAYAAVVYGKGTWVMHMLRLMLRDEKAKDPDARFSQLLRALAENYGHKGLTNKDLQREVEKLMTPEMDLEGGHSLDWFFDQFVQGTEIPTYSVQYKVAQAGEKFVVTGTLKQKDVSSIFVARVPLYAETARGRQSLLGTVTTAGEETRFRFVTSAAPRKLLIDPRMTLLAFTE